MAAEQQGSQQEEPCVDGEKWDKKLGACVPADPFEGQELILGRGDAARIFYWNPWKGAEGEWESINEPVPEPVDVGSQPVAAADIDTTDGAIMDVIADADPADGLFGTSPTDTDDAR